MTENHLEAIVGLVKAMRDMFHVYSNVSTCSEKVFKKEKERRKSRLYFYIIMQIFSSFPGNLFPRQNFEQIRE